MGVCGGGGGGEGDCCYTLCDKCDEAKVRSLKIGQRYILYNYMCCS